MLTLYHSPGSSSMATLIALHEVGAPFELKRIVLNEREKDPLEFGALNPEGKVPTLVVDGTPLTEVAATLYYLARAFPEARLWPADNGDVPGAAQGQFIQAQIISWMSFVASTVHPARRQGPEHAGRIYELADRRLGSNTWTVGAYSIADIHLFRLFWRFRGGLDRTPGAFPNLTAHYDRMMQRPAVQKTLELDQKLGYALPA